MAVVSRNAETLDGLQAYLRGVGIDAQCADTLVGIAEGVAPRCRAFVLFPDDYPTTAVDEAIARLRTRRPPITTIIVTASPARFAARAEGARAIVIAKPAWGWMILDAIRGWSEELR